MSLEKTGTIVDVNTELPLDSEGINLYIRAISRLLIQIRIQKEMLESKDEKIEQLTQRGYLSYEPALQEIA